VFCLEFGAWDSGFDTSAVIGSQGQKQSRPPFGGGAAGIRTHYLLNASRTGGNSLDWQTGQRLSTVDSSELILQKIESAAIGLTDDLSVHKYFQRIWFEVAYASYSLQEGSRSQPEFINCPGRPDIQGTITLKDGDYLLDSPPQAHLRQHEEPKNSQEYDQEYQKHGCIHRLSAYTKPPATATSVRHLFGGGRNVNDLLESGKRLFALDLQPLVMVA
jgi:hypothetical protein